MTTNQEARHQNLRDQTGTAGSLTSDWHAYWDSIAVDAGTFNERMLTWINSALGTSYTNVTGAMHAYAVDKGFDGWEDMNNLNLVTFDVGDAYLIEAGDFLLLESGDKYLIDF